MAKARIHDNKLKSFERNVRFLGRRTLIGNHRTVFALMNSFLAEHFGHSLSLSLSFPSFLSLRLSSINKRGGRRYCRILPFVITRQNKKMEKADGGIKGGKKRGAKKKRGKNDYAGSKLGCLGSCNSIP